MENECSQKILKIGPHTPYPYIIIWIIEVSVQICGGKYAFSLIKLENSDSLAVVSKKTNSRDNIICHMSHFSIYCLEMSIHTPNKHFISFHFK